MTGVWRLLRLELRRNAMLPLLPVIGAMFWWLTYRRSMSLPPLWNVRAMSMQGTVIALFIPVVVGVGAWMGAREVRRGMTDLLDGTARPRWARQVTTWSATTGWALLAYAVCVGTLYAVTAGQSAWGGPLWWPVVVGAASVPTLSAIGFATGAALPSRFTPPLAAVATFLVMEISLQFIRGGGSYWQISPLVSGRFNLGNTEGVATFYPYLPDLSIAQLILLAGLTAALLGALGLPRRAGGPLLRRYASAVTVVGLVVTGAAVGLAGTGKEDPHGMITIPALHNAADDRPVAYTPICRGTAIPVCLHPAYAVYLPAVSTALEPVLDEVAGLPGAPARICQAETDFSSGPHETPTPSGAAECNVPHVYRMWLPNQSGGPNLSPGASADWVRSNAAEDILTNVIGLGTDPATGAVMAAMQSVTGVRAGLPDDPAARRFAALPAATRHAWLAEHLTALRAGQITLAELP